MADPTPKYMIWDGKTWNEYAGGEDGGKAHASAVYDALVSETGSTIYEGGPETAIGAPALYIAYPLRVHDVLYYCDDGLQGVTLEYNNPADVLQGELDQIRSLIQAAKDEGRIDPGLADSLLLRFP